jgi:phospholipid/cholesterol/gamma-HCH transport system permease protein
MLIATIDTIGSRTLMLCNSCGAFVLFLYRALRTGYQQRINMARVYAQMEHIGVNSLSIAVLTGLFAGAVFAFQSYIAVKRLGGEEFIGAAVALSLARELSPVLTGLMVTGRAGSAIAAEIGTMRITEQIDALTTVGINPIHYLIVPRIIAGMLILPFLSLFTTFAGIAGGYCVAVYALDLNSYDYLVSIQKCVELSDVGNGLVKTAVFGLILTWVGCYKGYHAHGGARGVGIATTESVVIGSMLMLSANYLLTALLF